jgi:hypothetical protein
MYCHATKEPSREQVLAISLSPIWKNGMQVSFFIQGRSVASGLYYKQVMIVIYDRMDIGLYYKTRDDRNWRS